MRHPPQGVRLCMEAVCILFGEQPARLPNPEMLGTFIYDYWVTGQKVLSDIHFLNRIRKFDRDKVPDSVIEIIRK